MPKIYRLESDTDVRNAGIALTFDDNKAAIKLEWQHGAPLSATDCLEMAKQLAIRACDHLIKTNRFDEANTTNWHSVVAACQRHVTDWNDGLKAHVYGLGASSSDTVDARAPH